MHRTAIRIAAFIFPLALIAAEPPATPAEPAAAAPKASKVIETPTLARSLERGLSRVRSLQKAAEPSKASAKVEQALPKATARLAEMGISLRAAGPDEVSFRELDMMRVEWMEFDTMLAGWESTLEAEAKFLDEARGELKSLDETWRATVADESGDRVPAVLIEKIDTLLLNIEALRASLRDRAAALLLVQDEVSSDRARIGEGLERMSVLSTEIGERLFAIENDPLWVTLRTAGPGSTLGTQIVESGRAAAGEVARLLGRYRGRFGLQLAMFGVLGAAGAFLVRRVRADAEADPRVRVAASFLDRPFSAACILSLFSTFWIYPPTAVPLHGAALTLLLLPYFRFIPKLTLPQVRGPAYALGAVFLLDRVHDFALPHSLFARLTLLAIGFVGLACWAWALRNGSRRVSGEPPAWRTGLRVLVRIAIALLVIAIVANVVGNVSLAEQLTVVSVKGAFAGGVLYIVARILGSLWVLGLAYLASRGLPLALRHQDMLERRGRFTIRAIAAVIWLVFVLWIMRIIEQSSRLVVDLFARKWTVGNLHVGLGAIAAFAVALTLGIITARLLRFFLDEAVFPRMSLPRGVPAAISTTVGYVVVTAGFVMALFAAGIELGQFGFLAGAFGLGIGFGLQNIVNNFVSGIILLYERPIQVGDVLEVGTMRGRVSRIGIRSSTLATFDGAEVIVPNASLISTNVVNWTLSDRIRRVDIAVGAAYGTDPKQVLTILDQVARAHAEVLASPAPTALFVRFGESSLDFEVRVWTPEYDESIRVGSEVRTSIVAAFRQAGIEIPFPQRDLHVKSVAPATTAAAAAAGTGTGLAENSGTP